MQNSSVLPLIFCLLFFACSRQEERQNEMGTYLEEVLEHKVHERDIDSFTLPDSINPALIFAMYFEESPRGHSIILFDDTSRVSARRIKYLGDTVEIDVLKKTNYNVFESQFDKSEYVVYEDFINHEIDRSANVKLVNHYTRTDHKRR